MVNSIPTEHLGDKEDLNLVSWKSLVELPNKIRQSATPEFQQVLKEMTSVDKLNFYSQHTHRLSLFQKLEAGSILRGKSLSPFWNELSQEIFNSLSFATKTDYVDLDLTWLNGCVKDTTANSWFSMTAHSVHKKNSLEICCPSSTASLLGYTDLESTEKKSRKSFGKIVYKNSNKPTPNSTLKIPLFPEKELHLIWKQWLAAYRWIYNQCVAFLNSKQKLIGISLDQYIQEKQNEPDNTWTKCIGKTRQEAVCEAQQAYKQAFNAWKNKPKEERKSFKLKFKSCRNNSQTIQFKNDAYRKGTWFCSKVKDLNFSIPKNYNLPLECEYGTELIYKKGKWFGCFPTVVEEVQTENNKVIAIDPGNRTFLTGYDGKAVVEIGKGDIGRITRLSLHLDKLISKKAKTKGKNFKRYRYKLNKVIVNLRFKIKNLVNEVHKKATNFLVNNYKLIFLPTYNSSEMIIKKSRKIKTKSVRQMLSWAFARFASHLQQAARKQNVLVVRTNESFTSKTCPKCGHIHKFLSGNKVFKCPNCNFKAPRDFVGAVNNMLAAMQATAFKIEENKLIFIS